MRDPNTTRVALTLKANFVKIVNFVAFRTDFDKQSVRNSNFDVQKLKFKCVEFCFAKLRLPVRDILHIH